MGHGGDLSIKECWRLLGDDTSTVLIDVRTRAEWAYVGLPKLEDEMQSLILLEWQVFPEMQVDDDFSSHLEAKLGEMGASKTTNLCFLCRSGVRSLAAAKAMTARGYANTFNVTGGFEGDLNSDRHRGHQNGWKAEGLPWQQR